jgi:hypothetical protein
MAEERRVGALTRVSAHTFDTVYDLVFTTERMIALIVEHPGDLPRRFGMTEMLVGGRLGRRGEQMERRRIGEERTRLYEQRALGELAGLHRLNFEIPYGRIDSVEIRRGLFRPSLVFHLSGSGRAIRFRLRKGQADEAKRLTDEMLR